MALKEARATPKAVALDADLLKTIFLMHQEALQNGLLILTKIKKLLGVFKIWDVNARS